MAKDKRERTIGWAEQLRGVLAETAALVQKLRKVREVLPPVQSGMAVRLQEFEQTFDELLKDESVQRLLQSE